MSIDVEREELIHFPEATRAFPGKRVSLPTLHRWRLRGVRGVKLETCVVGSLRYTSKEAIIRFVTTQNSDAVSLPTRSRQRQLKDSEAARHELDKKRTRT